jgi:cystine transport system permease protein
MIESLGPLLWAALKFTAPLTLLSFAFGLVLGLVVALIRLFGPKPLVPVVRFYVRLIRGTPLLVQLFLIFYGLPSVGIVLDAFPAALIGFTLNIGAYTSEIIRAVIASVPRGQWEAAYSIGMTWRQAMQRTILPQAARVAVPPLSNTLISLVKDTSLASTILVTELLRVAQLAAAPTFDFFALYGVAAVYYWVICLILSFAQNRLESRLERYVAR